MIRYLRPTAPGIGLLFVGADQVAAPIANEISECGMNP